VKKSGTTKFSGITQTSGAPGSRPPVKNWKRSSVLRKRRKIEQCHFDDDIERTKRPHVALPISGREREKEAVLRLLKKGQNLNHGSKSRMEPERQIGRAKKKKKRLAAESVPIKRGGRRQLGLLPSSGRTSRIHARTHGKGKTARASQEKCELELGKKRKASDPLA